MRTIMGLNVKKITDNVPSLITNKIILSEAEQIKNSLESIGTTVEIK